MRILSIDSSTPQGSIALIDNDSIVLQSSLPGTAAYSGRILSLVDQGLTRARLNLSDVDGFALTTGPGSFTGLRVGVSLIKGFVLATEKPFVGVDTLEAVAGTVAPASMQICAILDARKRETYAAFFRYAGGRLARLSPDQAIAADALCARVAEPTIFAGGGADRFGGLLAARLGTRCILDAPLRGWTTAASAAFLAARRFAAEKSFDLNGLKINYMRKPEAEIKFGA